MPAPSPLQRYAQVTGLAQTASIRTASFDGTECLVVPVIALLGNVVVRPLNSLGPEFVPAEELAAAPASWNGRPVLPDHPSHGTASANDPVTLEAQRFGYIFNAEYSDGKLKVEAWLDPVRAEKVGIHAQRVIERCRSGEVVEVSVGCWITAEKRSGSYNGRRYEYVWSNPIPDHLAMLPEGVEGACSVEMGCGAPRVNRKSETGVSTGHLSIVKSSTHGMIVNTGSPERNPKMPSSTTSIDVSVTGASGLLSRMKSWLKGFGLTALAEDGVSDVDLRDALYTALRAIEPGFDWIVEVFPDSSTVIYTTFPENEVLWFRRSFSVNDAGEVSLNDDREQVQPVTRYEPVLAVASTATTSESNQDHSCSCHTSTVLSHSPSTEETTNMPDKPADTKAKLIQGLVGNRAAPFTDADVKVLEGFTEDRLKALADSFPEPKPDHRNKTEELGNIRNALANMNESDMLAVLPQQLHDRVLQSEKRDAEQRIDLIGRISSHRANQYSEEDLNRMETGNLEKLAKTIEAAGHPHDYSGRGLAQDSDPNDDIYLNPPDPYDLKGLEVARLAQAKKGAAN